MILPMTFESSACDRRSGKSGAVLRILFWGEPTYSIPSISRANLRPSAAVNPQKPSAGSPSLRDFRGRLRRAARPRARMVEASSPAGL